jgi:mono/diheme cytochrome c family protein
MAFLAGCALALGACGGDDEAQTPTVFESDFVTGTAPTITSAPTPTPRPQPVDVPVPVDLRPRDRPAFIAGRDVARDGGCLACHRIGNDGGDLGSNLNGVGDRLSPGAIRRALLRPEAPMPPYGALPDAKLDALVVFLAALGVTAPGPPCPDDSDCG